MPLGPPELPSREDDFDARVLADIRRYGWHCILVADEHHQHHAALNAALPPDPVHDASFAYTAGLSLSFRHAEVALVGRWAQAHGILAAVANLIEAGNTFTAGDTTDEVLEGTTCGSAQSPKRGGSNCSHTPTGRTVELRSKRSR